MAAACSWPAVAVAAIVAVGAGAAEAAVVAAASVVAAVAGLSAAGVAAASGVVAVAVAAGSVASGSVAARAAWLARWGRAADPGERAGCASFQEKCRCDAPAIWHREFPAPQGAGYFANDLGYQLKYGGRRSARRR